MVSRGGGSGAESPFRKAASGRLGRTEGPTVPLRGRGRYLRRSPRGGRRGLPEVWRSPDRNRAGSSLAERNARRPSGVPSTILDVRRLFCVPRGGVGTLVTSSLGVISLFSPLASPRPPSSSPFLHRDGVFPASREERVVSGEDSVSRRRWHRDQLDRSSVLGALSGRSWDVPDVAGLEPFLCTACRKERLSRWKLGYRVASARIPPPLVTRRLVVSKLKKCTLSCVRTGFYARCRCGCLSEGNLCRGRKGVGLDLEDEGKRCIEDEKAWIYTLMQQKLCSGWIGRDILCGNRNSMYLHIREKRSVFGF